MLSWFAAREALSCAVGVLKATAIDGDEHAELRASRGDARVVAHAIDRRLSKSV